MIHLLLKSADSLTLQQKRKENKRIVKQLNIKELWITEYNALTRRRHIWDSL